MPSASGFLCRLTLSGVCICLGCRHLDRSEPPPFPPRPLPPEVAAYRPESPGWGLEIVPVGAPSRLLEISRFTFWAHSGSEGDIRQVVGTLYRTHRVQPLERAPLLNLAPILAGAVDNYLACRVFARWACAEGMSAFYLHQDEDVLTVDRDSLRLEEILTDNLQDNIRALDLLTSLPYVDPERLGSIGISMGAIKNVALVAAEPRLKANVFCLGGADMPEIFATSNERRVVRYLEARTAWDRADLGEICAEADVFLRSEPLRWASTISNERSLVFLGIFDDKVPYACGLKLWEMLGRPEAYFLPLGHYTGISAAPFAAGRMFEYFRKRFDQLKDS